MKYDSSRKAATPFGAPTMPKNAAGVPGYNNVLNSGSLPGGGGFYEGAGPAKPKVAWVPPQQTKTGKGLSPQDRSLLRRQAMQKMVESDTKNAESAYDLRRQAIEGAGSEERQGLLTQTGEQMASQGFGRGSGMVEGAQRVADVEQRKREAGRLGGIDIEEMQAKERIGEAAKERDWRTSERIGSQGWQELQADLNRGLTREIEDGRIDLADRQLIQNAFQFTTEQDFKRWAVQQGIDENTATRAWQTSERLGTETYATGRMRLGAQIVGLNPDSPTFQKDLLAILDGTYTGASGSSGTGGTSGIGGAYNVEKNIFKKYTDDGLPYLPDIPNPVRTLVDGILNLFK